MGKNTSDTKAELTTWEIPDDVWPFIQTPLDEQYPLKPKGRRRVDLRRVLNGIIFRLRTSCQWNRLPPAFGDDSTVTSLAWCDRPR
jgi:putative transposase